MPDDPDAISLRRTVVDGQRQDEFEVTWRDLPIGRILKPPEHPHWWWACNLYGQPPTPEDRGSGVNFEECRVRFKAAWSRIRATLTEADIAVALKHAAELPPRQQPAMQGKPEQNRAAPRQRILKAGTIEFNGGAIDCVVRNISQTGAALEVASPLGIPDEFDLQMSGDHTRHRCRVAWRKEKRIGITFT